MANSLPSPQPHTSPGNHRDIPGINKTLSLDDPTIRTIRQHYYPEGGWGWVVTFCVSLAYLLTTALSPASGFLVLDTFNTFKPEEGIVIAVLIGSLSTTVTLFLSPIIMAICRRKSTRLTAILGGLVTALGCLFTSFATQFHQLFLSYGLIVGIGVSMIRDSSVIMIGQYFKKKREFVEIFVLSGTGLGIALMPLFLSCLIRSKNWRFGFQSLALVVFLNFFLAVLYRPASLYHPQRRAILHIKSLQKRSRMKAHKKISSTSTATSVDSNLEKPAYFDFAVLKSKTIQILICGTCISNFGITAPLILMAYCGEKEDISYASLLSLQAFYGISVILGTVAFGFIVVKNSVECMIARQYLCQASSLMISASLLAFTTLGDYSGYLLFVWIHGFFYGGYQYSLKMFVYEKVRARNFNRAWSFVQCAQSIPILVGIPITAFMNEHFGDRSGFYLSAATAAFGSLVLFFIDAHKKNSSRKTRLSIPENSTIGGSEVNNHLSRFSSRDSRTFFNPVATNTRVLRRASADSITDAAYRLNRLPPGTAVVPLRSNPFAMGRSNSLFSSTFGGPINELTCISEEVIMDNFLDEFVIDDCLTSCDREAKYLMLSEFENNIGNSVIPQEAAILVKTRKEMLKDNTKSKLEHDEDCPFKHVHSMVSSPTVPYFEPKRPLLAQNRRASFAGFASFVNDTDSVFSKPSTSKQQTIENECPSFLPSQELLNECSNCLRSGNCSTHIIDTEAAGPSNYSGLNLKTEILDEVDESIDDDSIDGDHKLITDECLSQPNNSQTIIDIYS